MSLSTGGIICTCVKCKESILRQWWIDGHPIWKKCYESEK